MRQLFFKVLVYTIGIGTGVIVLMALLAWPVRWYVNRPPSWTKWTAALVMTEKAKDNWESVPTPPKGLLGLLAKSRLHRRRHNAYRNRISTYNGFPEVVGRG